MYKGFLITLFGLIATIQTLAQQKQHCNCAALQETKELHFLAYKQSIIEKTSTICQAKSGELLMAYYTHKTEYDSAIALIEQIEMLYKKAACKNLNSFLNLAANVYNAKANFDKSIDYYLQILDSYNGYSKDENYIETVLNLSQIFNRIKQIQKSLAYTRLTIPYILGYKISKEKADFLNKLTARYFYAYQDTKEIGYRDSAWLFVNQALQVAKQMNDDKNKIIAYTRMNAIVESKKEYTLALRYIDSGMNLCDTNVHWRQLLTLYGDKGNIYMKQGNYAQAKEDALRCLNYSKQVKHPPLIANAYSLLYAIAKESNNYKEALEAMENEKNISDSLLAEKNIIKINELEKKYNQATNEKKISYLTQQRNIYILVGLLILLAIFFYIRHQQHKSRQKIVEAEQRLNRARINPHFFFNALSSLQAFALRENTGVELSNNLAKFSHIMRETLESTYKDYISIEQEIDFIGEYLLLQQIRFPNRFNFSIKADENIAVDELYIPSMIIQPFVENAIEHGLHDIDYVGKIDVCFSEINNEIKVTITDNGNGFHISNKETKHTSRASQIIKDRIYLLNIKLKSKARFSINNNKDNKGVLVEIYLPVLYEADINA